MLLTLNEFSPNASAFAMHCIDNCNVQDVIEMFYSGAHEDICSQFNITQEQWLNAIYVVIKVLGRGT